MALSVQRAMLGHMLPKTTRVFALLAFAMTAAAPAQSELDSEAILARVRAGGRFEETKWRRGEDVNLATATADQCANHLPGPAIVAIAAIGRRVDTFAQPCDVVVEGLG